MDLKNFDTVFISDLHLGNQFVDIQLLEEFLDKIKDTSETLCLVGDVFDSWRNCNPNNFEYLFKDFSNVQYVIGNHDRPFANKNPFNQKAVDSLALDWNETPGIITHGHLFDPNFNHTSLLGRLADSAIYNLSKLIGKDLKNCIQTWTDKYGKKLETTGSSSAELFFSKIIIMGHTHSGGFREINNTKIYNLGSWLTEPWAFFKQAEKYAFKKIEKNSLLPNEKDFREF